MIIGSESTGKSTLSEGLAKVFDTVWAPEYAREYLESLERPYEQDDLLEMAKGQILSEHILARKANKLLVCDTDLNVIKVWSDAKYGNCHWWIENQIQKRGYDLYILTDIDMPWVDDPLREHPKPQERIYFYNLYHNIVEASGLPFAIVSGNEEERLQHAESFIRASFNL